MDEFNKIAYQMLSFMETITSRMERVEDSCLRVEQQVQKLMLFQLKCAADNSGIYPPNRMNRFNPRPFPNEPEPNYNSGEHEYNQSFGRNFRPKPKRTKPFVPRSYSSLPAYDDSYQQDNFGRVEPPSSYDHFRMDRQPEINPHGEQLQSPLEYAENNPPDSGSGSAAGSAAGSQSDVASNDHETQPKMFFDITKNRNDQEYEQLQENPHEDDEYDQNEERYSNEDEGSNEFPGFDDEDEEYFDDEDNYQPDQPYEVPLPGMTNGKPSFEHMIIDHLATDDDNKDADGLCNVKAHLFANNETIEINAKTGLKAGKPRVSRAFFELMRKKIGASKKTILPGKGAVKIFEGERWVRLPVYLDQKHAMLYRPDFEVDPRLEADLVCNVLDFYTNRIK